MPLGLVGLGTGLQLQGCKSVLISWLSCAMHPDSIWRAGWKCAHIFLGMVAGTDIRRRDKGYDHD